jgi:hypothetical protein
MALAHGQAARRGSGGTLESQHPRAAIGSEATGTQQLTQSSGGFSALNVHLKQPVTCCDTSQQMHRVAPGGGSYERPAAGIEVCSGARLEARNRHHCAGWRQRLRHPPRMSQKPPGVANRRMRQGPQKSLALSDRVSEHDDGSGAGTMWYE